MVCVIPIYVPGFLWPTVKQNHLEFFFFFPLLNFVHFYRLFQRNRQLQSSIVWLYWQALRVILLEAFEFELSLSYLQLKCLKLFFLADFLLTVLQIQQILNQHIDYCVLKLWLFSFLWLLSLANTSFTRFHTIRNSKTGFAGYGPVAMPSVQKYQFSTGYESQLSSLRS